jgi:hypothetical protein
VKTVLRIFVLAWIIGTIFLFSTSRLGLFHWIGLSKMDVFNGYSIEAMKVRTVYYLKTDSGYQLLPLISPEGKGLEWIDNELLKYASYFRLTMQLMPTLKSGTNLSDIQNQSLVRQMVRPSLYEFCRSGRQMATYELELAWGNASSQNLSINLDRSKFSDAGKRRCEAIQDRWSLDSFELKSVDRQQPAETFPISWNWNSESF